MRWSVHYDADAGRWYVCRVTHEEAMDAETWEEACEWLRRATA